MKKKSRKKKKISILIKTAAFIVIGAAACYLSTTSIFDVTAYDISGNSYYSSEEIMIMGDCKTQVNILWDIKCKDIEERLLKDAYMEEVKVKRVLPSTVKIILTERKQSAAVVYGDNYVVIDQNNTVLRKTEIAPRLPLIKGVTISKLELGQPVEIEEKVRFRQIMELIGILDENDIYFKTILNSESEIKAYVFDYLICQGSPDDLMSAIKEGELQKVIKGLFSRGIERGTIKISGGNYISFSPEID